MNEHIKAKHISQAAVKENQMPYIKYLVYGVLSILSINILTGIAEALIEIIFSVNLDTFNYLIISSIAENIVLLFIINYYLKKININITELFSNTLDANVLWIIAAIFTSILLRYISTIIDSEMLKILPTFDLDDYYKLIIQNLTGTKNILLAFLAFGIVTGFCEEIFLRGFCYNLLRKRYTISTAILINTIIFLLFHPIPAYFVSFIIVNIMFCIFYEKSKSLLIPIVMHATINSVVVFSH